MHILKNILIKQKLTLIIIVISSTATLLACAALIIYDQITFSNTMKHNLSMLAQIIGKNSMAALIFENENDAKETLEVLLMAVENIDFACIYDKNDKVFTKYKRLGTDIGTLPPLPKDKECYFDNNHLIIFSPIIIEGEKIGKVYLQSNLKEMYARLKNYAVIVIFVLFLSFLTSYIMASKLRRIISEPILHLANTARDVSLRKDYSIRAKKTSKDELGFLTDQFNQMLNQIQEHEFALQNASHELKIKAQQLQNELSERKQAEKQIKKSLQEKEVLLKEIHHRVKNNLQVISSLLYLQSNKAVDGQTIELFNESQNRIRSMALIHEKLYQSEDLVNIDFTEYIKSLISYLFNSYKPKLNVINIQVNVAGVLLSIDEAIPCGLIINELISNSLKHAFPDNRKGKIKIKMTSNKQRKVTLTVEDNGVGFPEDLESEKTETLGLKLVNNLTNQLTGTIKHLNTNGTKFMITFLSSKIRGIK